MDEGNELWRELCELERKWEMQFDDGTTGRVDALTREQLAPPVVQGTELAQQVMRNTTERLRKRRTMGWRRVEARAAEMRRREQAKRRAA